MADAHILDPNGCRESRQAGCHLRYLLAQSKEGSDQQEMHRASPQQLLSVCLSLQVSIALISFLETMLLIYLSYKVSARGRAVDSDVQAGSDPPA